MRLRPTYANVASTLALVVALSGTAYAAATITGAQIRDNSLTGRDVRNNTLTTKDVRGLTKRDLRPGVLPKPGPGVRIEASGSPVVPEGVQQTFPMDTEAYDTGNMYQAPDDVVTVRRTGTYLVLAQVQYSGPAVRREVRIVVDGATVEHAVDDGQPQEATGQTRTLIRLTRGQTVSLGTRAIGGDVPVGTYTGRSGVWLALQWLAP